LGLLDPRLIQIFWIWICILPSSSKNSEKTLDFYCFVASLRLLSVKNDVNVSSKNNQQKKLEIFFPLTIRAVSGASGSVSHWYRSEDPYQNVTDSEHCLFQFAEFSTELMRLLWKSESKLKKPIYGHIDKLTRPDFLKSL
jgi:hypothetical protein